MPASATLRRSARIFLRLGCVSVARNPSKSRVAGIGPVELHATTAHPACFGERPRVGLGREQHVQRTQPAGVGLVGQRTRQRAARRCVARQQPRPGHRRERHRDQPLGVVGQPVAAGRRRPRPSRTRTRRTSASFRYSGAAAAIAPARSCSTTKCGCQPVSAPTLALDCRAARNACRTNGFGVSASSASQSAAGSACRSDTMRVR